MDKKLFVKTVVSSGCCTKNVAEAYASTKPRDYEFDGYEDFKEVSRLNEKVYKPRHHIVNHFAGRMNDNDI